LDSNTKQIFSEQGSVSMAGIMMSLTLSLTFILFLYCAELALVKLKNRTDVLICAKQAVYDSRHYVKRIEKLSKYIRLVRLGRVAISVLPFPLPASTSTKAAIDIMKGAQDLAHVSFLKKVYDLNRKLCRISLNDTITPYKTNYGVALERGRDKLPIMEKTKWKMNFLKGENRLTAELEYKNAVTALIEE